MKRPPRNSVQPSRFQEPLVGTNGEKLLMTTSPVTSGTTVTTSSGASAPTVKMVCTRAVLRMPRCWTFHTARTMIMPTMNTALTRRTSPSFRKPRLAMVHCHVLIVESGAKKMDSK